VFVSSREQDSHLKGIVKRGRRFHIFAHSLRRLAAVLGDAVAQVASDADVITLINAARGAVADAVDGQGFFTPPRAARGLPFIATERGA
jgi:hypothetical protein